MQGGFLASSAGRSCRAAFDPTNDTESAGIAAGGLFWPVMMKAARITNTGNYDEIELPEHLAPFTVSVDYDALSWIGANAPRALNQITGTQSGEAA